MGIFTNEEGQLSTKKIVSGLGAAFTATALYGSFYVLPQREVALITRFGGVVNEARIWGIHPKIPFVDTVHKYPLYRQRVEISADEANLRTGDQMGVQGGLFVEYEINGDSKDLDNLYNYLRAQTEDVNDVADIVKIRGKMAAVSSFGLAKAPELATTIDTITDNMKTRLQKSIDDNGWPVKILAVISNGVRLTPDAEKKLEVIMVASQEQTVLDLRKTNAKKAQEVLTEEGKALGNLYKAIAESGVRPEDVNTLVCLDMAQRAHRTQEPFSPGCFAGQNGPAKPAVSVAPPKQRAEQDTTPALEAPKP